MQAHTGHEPNRKPEPGIGLCLSGGGFRATLFNLGALWRLNELGILPRLDMITSVSGGSITAGVLAHRWSSLRFEQSGVASNFEEVVVEPLRTFCSREIAIPAAAFGLASPLHSVGQFMVKAYKDLYGAATLQDLPQSPRFVFMATNLETGASVRMSRKYLADYRIGMIDAPPILVAQAVAASSAFPPVLSPQVVDLQGMTWKPATEWKGMDALPCRLLLTDGGAYDNMGMEPVWDRWSTVLVSDAGAPLVTDQAGRKDWAGQLSRVLDIATEQSRALRRRWLVSDFLSKKRHGAYWSIRSRIEDYPIPDPIVQDTPAVRALANIRTHLDPFSAAEQGELINWGYAICDTALRSWTPELLRAEARPAQPVTNYALA